MACKTYSSALRRPGKREATQGPSGELCQRTKSKARRYLETPNKTTSRATPASGAQYAGTLAKTTDAQAKALILEHGANVRSLAWKMYDRTASLDIYDLIQVGVLGLIQAAHSWDESITPRFWGFAYSRVRGAMLDAVRDARQFPRYADGGYSMEPLDEADHEAPDVAPLELGSPRSWATIMAPLPKRERQILSLCFIRGLKLREVGALYGITDSRVQQICATALKRLSSNIQPERYPPNALKRREDDDK